MFYDKPDEERLVRCDAQERLLIGSDVTSFPACIPQVQRGGPGLRSLYRASSEDIRRGISFFNGYVLCSYRVAPTFRPCRTALKILAPQAQLRESSWGVFALRISLVSHLQLEVC